MYNYIYRRIQVRPEKPCEFKTVTGDPFELINRQNSFDRYRLVRLSGRECSFLSRISISICVHHRFLPPRGEPSNGRTRLRDENHLRSVVASIKATLISNSLSYLSFLPGRSYVVDRERRMELTIRSTLTEIGSSQEAMRKSPYSFLGGRTSYLNVAAKMCGYSSPSILRR